MVKHVSAGTLTSVTNFASSVSRNLDRLSLDSEHCQRNELVRRTLPQGVGHGLVNGMSGIGISILGAIGGKYLQVAYCPEYIRTEFILTLSIRL